MSTTLPVPRPAPLDEDAYARLVALVRRGDLAVLTGAGVSTASGIPDYRGPDSERRIQPMMYADFLASPENRQRYWARSFAGWRRFSAAGPNESHAAVAALQRAGLVRGIITQNVDGLHQAGGARDVIELHGNLDRVVCLNCGEHYSREGLHERLAEANPDFHASSTQIRPDGDVVLADEQVTGFRVATCLVCRSDLLKPDVVFFGGSVARPLARRALDLVESSSALLVLGSSLQVMSGYRFVRRAAALGLPVAILTRGVTRGDAEATISVDALLGPTLRRLLADLGLD